MKAVTFHFTPQASVLVADREITTDAHGVERLVSGRAAVSFAMECYCRALPREEHLRCVFPSLRADEIGEIRAYVPRSQTIHKPHWASFYFDSVESFVKAIEQLDGKAFALYTTINPKRIKHMPAYPILVSYCRGRGSNSHGPKATGF